MKRYTLIVFLFIPSLIYGQGFSMIEDKAAHAQERRDTYLRWGDWRPKEWGFAGIQLNPLHTLVWGWAAPENNRKYKDGGDIRPLGPYGKQTLSTAARIQQRAYIDKMLEDAKEIGVLADQEILYYSKETAKLDPLYIIYFKKVLKPVYEFNPGTLPGECKKPDVYQFLDETGTVKKHISEMDILKDRLSGLFDSNIERGQRIIMYHKILADYRRENETWKRHIQTTTAFLDMDKKGAYTETVQVAKEAFNEDWEERSRQIAREVMIQAEYESKYQ